jgi:hypothetical protein
MVSKMPKFLYCMMCNHGFKLDTKKVRVCKCGNLRGRYRLDRKIVEINAENPEQARFIGIGFDATLFEYEKKTKYPEIYEEIINQDVGLYEQIESYPELKNTKAWEDFEILMNEFFDKDTDDKWAEYEKTTIVKNMEDWKRILNEKRYVVGTVDSLKKCNWHRRWVYCECLCFHD